MRRRREGLYGFERLLEGTGRREWPVVLQMGYLVALWWRRKWIAVGEGSAGVAACTKALLRCSEVEEG
jgi:hypothetical protein